MNAHPSDSSSLPGKGRTVLLVDDDPIQLKLTRAQLALAGFAVRTAASTLEAIQSIQERRPEAVLSDVLMRDLDGFTLCRKLRQELKIVDLPVVLASAHFGGAEDRELATAVGAQALVQRTPDFHEELQALTAAMSEPITLEAQAPATIADLYARRVIAQLAHFACPEPEEAAPTPSTAAAGFHGLVGKTPQMQELATAIRAAGGGRGAVLVAGESGTGKELVARAVHDVSGGERRPFVPVNCAAFPRELIESELFGYGKGAYTGARGAHLGLVRAADGGTLFLDEITEMAPATQAKLLRVLEERVVRPVGTLRELPVNVRFLASTNRDPERAVAEGVLRKDLYHRLSVFRVPVPALRERLDDVPVLIEHFLAIFQTQGMRRVEQIEPDAAAMLEAYTWPGNVRELKNAVEYALAAGQGPKLRLQDLPVHIRGAKPTLPAPQITASGGIPTLEDAEAALIRQALDATHGNKQKAARLLRISRHRLYDRLHKMGIEI